MLSFSYLVEGGFSAVKDLITKKRNRLAIGKRGDWRLHPWNIEQNIKKRAPNAIKNNHPVELFHYEIKFFFYSFNL